MSAQTQAPLWPEMEAKSEQKKRMGSFGERMQREREMRSITLEEISESTKISTRFLRALEEEQFARLPGGIFNKGFVRAYARFLGIDEEQAVADFVAVEEQYAKEQEDRQPGAPGTNREMLTAMRAVADSDPLEAPPSNGFLIGAVILVSLLGIGGFVYKYFEPGRSGATVPPAASQPALNAAATAAHSATPQKSEVEPVTKETTSPPATAEPAPAASGTSFSSSGPIQLEIRARQPSWVQVTADGKVTFAEMVFGNSQKTFQADREMVVKLGNAGGVELVQNGKALPPFPPQTTTRVLTFTVK